MKKTVAVLTISSLLIFQSCSLLNRKLTQEVPVTSNPIGARIIIDGKDAGQAPLMLTLKKNKRHIIRIEKEGYNPTELRVTRKISALIALEVLFIPVMAGGSALLTFFVVAATRPDTTWDSAMNTMRTWYYIGGAVGAAALLGDIVTGRIDSLSPRSLEVTLTKLTGQGSPQVQVIYLDSEQLKDIQWLRIKLAGESD
jgi:PEGA domain